MPGPFDSLLDSPLVLAANAGPGPPQYLSPLSHIFGKNGGIFIIRFNFVVAKLAVSGNRSDTFWCS